MVSAKSRIGADLKLTFGHIFSAPLGIGDKPTRW
jgi:hypothetical protein